MTDLKPPTDSEFLQIANSAVRETVQAFFQHPYGFHGDTGIQNYLYHRLLTNAGTRAVWPTDPGFGKSTLLVQVELYTRLTYQNKGKSPSRGRFDLALVDGSKISEEDALPRGDKLPPVVAIEVGKNKEVPSILGQMDAAEDEEAPMPGDAAKLIRELRFSGLKGGYLLEFFDDRTATASSYRTKEVSEKLASYLEKIGESRLRIVLATFRKDCEPEVWLYPTTWAEQMDLPFGNSEQRDGLIPGKERNVEVQRWQSARSTIDEKEPPRRGSESRVSFAEFCGRCSEGGRAIQNAFRSNLPSRFSLVHGGLSMTVNLKGGGRIARINNEWHSDGERISDHQSVCVALLSGA
jgi:hypothetical protein